MERIHDEIGKVGWVLRGAVGRGWVRDSWWEEACRSSCSGPLSNRLAKTAGRQVEIECKCFQGGEAERLGYLRFG